MAHLEMVLRDELNATANIMTTVYPNSDLPWLTSCRRMLPRESGLKKLAIIEGLKPENVMVCGDNYNDLEMLEYAGTAVVMGNASLELLEREKFHTTLSNDENGVAAAVERFILN